MKDNNQTPKIFYWPTWFTIILILSILPECGGTSEFSLRKLYQVDQSFYNSKEAKEMQFIHHSSSHIERSKQLKFKSEKFQANMQGNLKEESLLFIDDTWGLGRLFDGIGGLSAGASSKLLISYPQEQRSQILDYLFKPNFGAALQILKVEIGGDVQSTDGTESSHMHTSWDENYERGYEWWLMAEAKKRNPSIKLYGLPWGFPGWLGENSQSPYHNITALARYIVNWIHGARVYHNLTIDYVGIWNERPYNIPYIKTLRSLLNEHGYEKTQIIAADDKWRISVDISLDKNLSDVVYGIGCHYPGTYSTRLAQMTTKQLWSSEDFSSFNDDVGGGCWARILNQNYVNGFMTSTISWALIASYYKGLPFYRTGLMTATEPWTGHYVVDTPIWLSAHTSQFTEVGWRYLQHESGVGHLPQGGSYVSLVSPDKNHLTIVIETMAKIPEMAVWCSKLMFGPPGDTMFEYRGKIKFKDEVAELSLGLDEVWTLTTLTTGHKGSHPPSPPSRPFPLPYHDDFESESPPQEPANLTPQFGVFEVAKGDQSNVVRQVVMQTPVTWIPSPHLADQVNKSIAVIGNASWSDILIQVDFEIPAVNGTEGVIVATRVNNSGWQISGTQGMFFFAFLDRYMVTSDFRRSNIILEGPLEIKSGEWHQLSLYARGQRALGAFDGQALFNLSLPAAPTQGFPAIGTDNFGLADFDNLYIAGPQEGLAKVKQYFLSTR